MFYFPLYPSLLNIKTTSTASTLKTAKLCSLASDLTLVVADVTP
jgi:hypothetical protein